MCIDRGSENFAKKIVQSVTVAYLYIATTVCQAFIHLADLATISLEARIVLKAYTAEINCTQTRSAKFLESMAINMTRAASTDTKSALRSKSTMTLPATIRYGYSPARLTYMYIRDTPLGMKPTNTCNLLGYCSPSSLRLASYTKF